VGHPALGAGFSKTAKGGAASRGGSNQALEFRGGLNDLEFRLGENPLHFVELENFPHFVEAGLFRRRLTAPFGSQRSLGAGLKLKSCPSRSLPRQSKSKAADGASAPHGSLSCFGKRSHFFLSIPLRSTLHSCRIRTKAAWANFQRMPLDLFTGRVNEEAQAWDHQRPESSW
jgi:hypothetical protein